jgi:hypothetical protein
MAHAGMGISINRAGWILTDETSKITGGKSFFWVYRGGVSEGKG